MTFPSSIDDLRGLVATMRELGVSEAFGVKLGDAPRKFAPEPMLTGEARRLSDWESEREGALQMLRDSLAHTGTTYTDDALDGFLPDRLRAGAGPS